MRLSPVAFALILAAASLATGTTAAQTPGSPAASRAAAPERGVSWVRSEPGMHEFSLWGGYAYNSHRVIGETEDVTLRLAGGRYNRKLLRWDRHILEYTAQLTFYSRYSWPDKEKEHRTRAGGVGFSPAGLQFNFYNGSTFQPYLRSTGGFMLLEQPFPDSRGSRLNFTFGVGGGIEILFAEGYSLSLGYSFFHLSNGEIGSVNPGIDSSLFTGTLTLF